MNHISEPSTAIHHGDQNVPRTREQEQKASSDLELCLSREILPLFRFMSPRILVNMLDVRLAPCLSFMSAVVLVPGPTKATQSSAATVRLPSQPCRSRTVCTSEPKQTPSGREQGSATSSLRNHAPCEEPIHSRPC